MHCLLIVLADSLMGVVPRARVLLHTLQKSFNLFLVILGRRRCGQSTINSRIGQGSRYTV